MKWKTKASVTAGGYKRLKYFFPIFLGNDRAFNVLMKLMSNADSRIKTEIQLKIPVATLSINDLIYYD